MIDKHLVPTWLAYNVKRIYKWQHPLSLHNKLYGDAGNLELTVAVYRIINVSIYLLSLYLLRGATSYSLLGSKASL
jgi:hypothetical protein